MLNFREDSITNIVDDLSLFEINKFKGIDYIDRGEKLTCGFENSLFFRNKKLLNFFIGQSKHAIGKATLNISDVVSLRTRFVGAPCGKHNKIFECGSRTQFSKICFDFSYFGDKQKNKYRDFDLSQIGGSVSYKINSCWKIVYSQIFNLKKGVGHKSLSSGIFAKYKNECLDFGIGVYKSHYRDLDLKPKTGIIITFSFKTLGNFSQNLNMHQHLRMISSVE
jgi:lipopolysaccharide assembly outer membrane protein LptD (OstA)